jgi:hypothetical protein
MPKIWEQPEAKEYHSEFDANSKPYKKNPYGNTLKGYFVDEISKHKRQNMFKDARKGPTPIYSGTPQGGETPGASGTRFNFTTVGSKQPFNVKKNNIIPMER